MSEKPFLNSLDDIAAVRAYLARIKAQPRSLNYAVVEEQIKDEYWRDKVYIRFKDNADIITIYPEEYSAKYRPTTEEHTDIKAQWHSYRHPEYVKLNANLLNEELKKRHKNSREKDNLFVFYNSSKTKVLMLQEKIYDDRNIKHYVPWTYWEDKKWRKAYPPGKSLPLYGLDQFKELGRGNVATIFIHEGAKGARYCKRLMQDGSMAHPWKDDLYAVHLAWIGGALHPYLTNWEEVRRHKPTCVYIIPDNDDEGYEAVPKISEQMQCLTYSLQYPDGFGRGFDLADPIPENYYENERYVGPAFHECVNYATWLTDVEEIVDNSFRKPRIKYLTKLRPHVRGLWAYLRKTDEWALTRDLVETYKNYKFSRIISGFCHGKPERIVELLLKKQMRSITRSAYIPKSYTKRGESVVSDGHKLVLNMYEPSRIVSEYSDFSLWLDFMEHLIPNAEEREYVLKWCATLIAKPEIRMKYSVLLVSDTKGIGKSTLGEQILRPLVGVHNTSIVDDKIILSGFTSWAKDKTLIIIEEIYTGEKWTMYNRLKSLVTSNVMSLHPKGVDPYDYENMCHFFAASNSHKALKIENGDRRWLIPEVTEKLWDRFGELYKWIQSGGLSAIKYWAESYSNYVGEGDHAPLTDVKKNIIEESLSQPEVYARRIGEIIVRGFENEPAVIAIEDMKKIIENFHKGIAQSNLLLLKACIAGAKMADTNDILDYIIRPGRKKNTSRVYHRGKLNYCLGNKLAVEKFSEDLSNEEFRGEMLALMGRTYGEVLTELGEV